MLSTALDLLRLHLEQAADHLAARLEPVVHRRGDAVGDEIAGRHRAVVHDAEVAEPAPEIAEVHGDARHDLLLDADRELLVPLAVAPAGVDGPGSTAALGRSLTEEGVVERAAVAVGELAVQVALRRVVVRVSRPAGSASSCGSRCRQQRSHRVARVGSEPIMYLPQLLLNDGPAVAEEVVGDADARRDVLHVGVVEFPGS